MTALQALLAPIFLHVVLICYVGLRTAMGRVRSVTSGETRLKDIAVDNSKWPTHLKKLSNNFDNQFDVPMMWYGLCALLVGTGKVDGIEAGLSWLFLVSRVAHTYVHTGSNRQPARMIAYWLGIVVVLLMWIWFARRLFLLG